MELVVARYYKAELFAVKGLTDQKLGLTSVTVRGKVWGIQAIPQEEDVAPFLGPQLCPIYCGRQHYMPGPGLCSSSQATCVQDRVPLQCGRQCLLCLNMSASPHGRPTLPEAGRVFRRPELCLAPGCRD